MAVSQPDQILHVECYDNLLCLSVLVPLWRAVSPMLVYSLLDGGVSDGFFLS